MAALLCLSSLCVQYLLMVLVFLLNVYFPCSGLWRLLLLLLLLLQRLLPHNGNGHNDNGNGFRRLVLQRVHSKMVEDIPLPRCFTQCLRGGREWVQDGEVRARDRERGTQRMGEGESGGKRARAREMGWARARELGWARGREREQEPEPWGGRE